MVYTPNAIESVHSRLRKIIKTRGHFPSDDAVSTLIWLAMNQFAILFDERFTQVAHASGR